MILRTPRRFTILHFSQIFLTLGRTFMVLPLKLLDDLSAARVELGELDENSVSGEQSDDSVS